MWACQTPYYSKCAWPIIKVKKAKPIQCALNNPFLMVLPELTFFMQL